MSAPRIGPPGKGPFTVPLKLPRELLEIGRELSRIEESARFSSQGQFEMAKTWRGMNLWLGSLTAAASAAAGVLTFASESLRIPAGVAAVSAALLAAALTTIAPERRASRAELAANKYLAIQSSARRFLLVDLFEMDKGAAKQQLAGLAAEVSETNRGADPISGRARRGARQNIDSGGQIYGVDES